MNAIEKTFEQAKKLGFSHYGLQDSDKRFVKKNHIVSEISIAELKEMVYSLPAGDYVLVCSNGGRSEKVYYPFNTANASPPPPISENQDFPKMVSKTHKEIDPEKFGKLTAQLEYQETKIRELETRVAELQSENDVLLSELSELETEQNELSEPPPPPTAQDKLLDAVAPVIPVLAENLISFLKSKNTAPAQLAQPAPIDYEKLAEQVLKLSNEAQTAENANTWKQAKQMQNS